MWDCLVCHFQNDAQSSTCQMCSTLKPIFQNVLLDLPVDEPSPSFNRAGDQTARERHLGHLPYGAADIAHVRDLMKGFTSHISAVKSYIDNSMDGERDHAFAAPLQTRRTDAQLIADILHNTGLEWTSLYSAYQIHHCQHKALHADATQMQELVIVCFLNGYCSLLAAIRHGRLRVEQYNDGIQALQAQLSSLPVCFRCASLDTVLELVHCIHHLTSAASAVDIAPGVFAGDNPTELVPQQHSENLQPNQVNWDGPFPHDVTSPQSTASHPQSPPSALSHGPGTRDDSQWAQWAGIDQGAMASKDIVQHHKGTDHSTDQFHSCMCRQFLECVIHHTQSMSFLNTRITAQPRMCVSEQEPFRQLHEATIEYLLHEDDTQYCFGLCTTVLASHSSSNVVVADQPVDQVTPQHLLFFLRDVMYFLQLHRDYLISSEADDKKSIAVKEDLIYLCNSLYFVYIYPIISHDVSQQPQHLHLLPQVSPDVDLYAVIQRHPYLWNKLNTSIDVLQIYSSLDKALHSHLKKSGDGDVAATWFGPARRCDTTSHLDTASHLQLDLTASGSTLLADAFSQQREMIFSHLAAHKGHSPQLGKGTEQSIIYFPLISLLSSLSIKGHTMTRSHMTSTEQHQLPSPIQGIDDMTAPTHHQSSSSSSMDTNVANTTKTVMQQCYQLSTLNQQIMTIANSTQDILMNVAEELRNQLLPSHLSRSTRIVQVCMNMYEFIVKWYIYSQFQLSRAQAQPRQETTHHGDSATAPITENPDELSIHSASTQQPSSQSGIPPSSPYLSPFLVKARVLCAIAGFPITVQEHNRVIRSMLSLTDQHLSISPVIDKLVSQSLQITPVAPTTTQATPTPITRGFIPFVAAYLVPDRPDTQQLFIQLTKSWLEKYNRDAALPRGSVYAGEAQPIDINVKDIVQLKAISRAYIPRTESIDRGLGTAGHNEKTPMPRNSWDSRGDGQTQDDDNNDDNNNDIAAIINDDQLNRMVHHDPSISQFITALLHLPMGLDLMHATPHQGADHINSENITSNSVGSMQGSRQEQHVTAPNKGGDMETSELEQPHSKKSKSSSSSATSADQNKTKEKRKTSSSSSKSSSKSKGSSSDKRGKSRNTTKEYNFTQLLQDDSLDGGFGTSFDSFLQDNS